MAEDMPDISVIVTGHREGAIAGATARSAREAIDHATRAAGAGVEVILVLDRADAVTGSVLRSGLGSEARVLETDEGDPGQARNRGIEAARGRFATFLDGDDLWSHNWLEAAWKLAQDRPDAVIHSTCNLVFGKDSNIWWHVDSESAIYDPDYLHWANYWDAMSFAETGIYRRFPFRANDLKMGFGHEDWHWNCVTVAAGIAHKTAPGTMHFKRRRDHSQMAQVARSDAVIWPLEAGK